MANNFSGRTLTAEHITGHFLRTFPRYQILTTSITESGGITFFMVKNGIHKELIAAGEKNIADLTGFFGLPVNFDAFSGLICKLNEENADAIRQHLPFTAPVPVGKGNSFGFGDRLGNAGVAHLKALSGHSFFPVLAQQSIREMDRTGRTAREVMDAATWSVLECGHTSGFGADADHLKTTQDIDRTIGAGFTMFTIDPGEFVDNRIENMDKGALKEAFRELPWDNLSDAPDVFLGRYNNRSFNLSGHLQIQPSETDILRAAVKYGHVLAHTAFMYRYLRDSYPGYRSEFELSVDETPQPTTPVEHLVIASELQRLGIELISLAPRFRGDFEKGIDFKGDIEAFKEDYILHQAIAGNFGKYKISFHSGSDKFRVYEAIGRLNLGTVHIKTAGTSYLEALRAVSIADPSLFREIAEFSAARFEKDSQSYHISARADEIPDLESLRSKQLPGLLDDDAMRQVFHVSFGSILTAKDKHGNDLFRDRLMILLAENEEIYSQCLYRHFRRHLEPFDD
jgi:tagaturonate epimerase